MTGPWVLMYHRVCERGPDTRCWFERGTAVTPAALDAQLAWLRDRFALVPLEELHEPARSGDRARPRAALTFDDGYADTLAIAAPICARHGATATCFASAGPAMGGPALWFDAWYAIVHAGLGRRGWEGALRRWDVPLAEDLAACVRGPAKRWLAALLPADRDRILDGLAGELGAVLPAAHYLDLDDLRRLRRLGWRIGGHGVHHRRLGDCADPELLAELRGSRRLLADAGESGALLFAYPDGSSTDRVADAVAAAGFAFACTVERGPWADPAGLLTIPRLFCRGDGPSPHALLAGI